MIQAEQGPVSQSTSEGAGHRRAFMAMTMLFFFWGFMTALNDILIPRFKAAFALTYFQAMLVQFAFFGAYFIGALLYFIISATRGDPIARIGYKNGIVIGLLISALGSALFWPAAAIKSYSMFLGSLFIVGLGFAMLQIAANPYVTMLGPEKTASSRLNLAQGFNSVGTTVGPLIGGYLIFQYFAQHGAHGVNSVKVPYLVFCVIFLVLATVFSLISLPEIRSTQSVLGSGVLKYPHVALGIVAIFMYVGGEVAVGSAIINFLGDPKVAGLSEIAASKFVSLYWGGLLIGRFMGAIKLSEMPTVKKQVLLAITPIAAFLLLWIVQSAPLTAMHDNPQSSLFAVWWTQLGANWSVFQNYLCFVGICWALFYFGKANAAHALMVFNSAIVVLLTVAVIIGGRTAMWCVVAVGLFSSIGFSNIFSLAIDGLGPLKSQASSLLIMAILGGALLPLMQGLVADVTKNLPLSFIVPLFAYAYVAFYGAKGHRIGRAGQTNAFT